MSSYSKRRLDDPYAEDPETGHNSKQASEINSVADNSILAGSDDESNQISKDQKSNQIPEGMKIDPETGELVPMTEMERRITDLHSQLALIKKRKTILEKNSALFPLAHETTQMEFNHESKDDEYGQGLLGR